MNKRGITLSTLIAIILLVIAFGVIFYFIWTLGFDQRADREACHTSIVLRGTISSIPVLDLGKSSIPLKCKEKKVCLASGILGECDEFGNEKGITRVLVGGQNLQTNVAKTISKEIVECWEMTGQGKLDLFSGLSSVTGLGGIRSSCLICSRIAVDEKLKDSEGDKQVFRDVDVLTYMLNHTVPGKSVSYIQYMLGGNYIPGEQAKLGIADYLMNLKTIDFEKDAVAIQAEVDRQAEETKKQTAGTGSVIAGLDEGNPGSPPISNEDLSALIPINSDGTIGTDDTSTEVQLWQDTIGNEEELKEWQGEELAVVFMQVTAPKQGESILNLAKVGVTGAAGMFLIAPIKTVTTAIACVSNPYCWFTIGAFAAGQQGNVAYQRHVAAGYCGDVSHGTEARNGCSVVRVFKYNVTEINKYCSGNIESIP